MVIITLCSTFKKYTIFQAVYPCFPCVSDSRRRRLSCKALSLSSSVTMLSVCDAAKLQTSLGLIALTSLF